MKTRKLFLCYTLFLFPFFSFSQNIDSIQICFYNLENYFDTRNDSLKNDDEFTPEGKNNWTYHRFQQKRNNIYKTLIALGQWSPPAIVGLCEVENAYVLNELCRNTPLRKFNYQYIHFESPDTRGIDVALLYNPSKFQHIISFPIQVTFPFDSKYKTRDILYVKGVVFNLDTIHFYVNHFPSRLGGKKSIRKRNYAARLLKKSIDSIFATQPAANIVVMGDFNDTPFDVSIKDSLGAAIQKKELEEKTLYNLMATKAKHEGTNKYHAQWSLIDQFIISKYIYEGGNMYVEKQEAQIFKADFLLIEDEKNLGVKPFRTFLGPKYLGGFSDHLPIYFNLKKHVY